MATRRKREVVADSAITGSEAQADGVPPVPSPRAAVQASLLAGLSETLGQMMSNCLDVQEHLRTVHHGLHEATAELHEVRGLAQAVKQELFQTKASLDGIRQTLQETREDIQACFKDTGEKFLLLGQACRDLQQELRGVRDEVEQLRKDRRDSSFVPPIPGTLRPAASEVVLAIEEVPEPLVLELDAPGPQGKATLGITVDPDATVLEVLPGTPAEKAGLQAGDTLLEINGKSITSSAELRAAIDRADAGGEVRLQVARGQQTEELKAHLVDLGGEILLRDSVT